ncbi:hypothetical protein EWM64_g434 [Hericium alpestre]|uniref:Uncharacterized protein n=1 Tax=Hericium alpestre TaxID=135208 RepID=A0A4Z0AA25_9AGAM|nr:hypothetical protein EWM64_g434 [Hericium alpestre]
MRELNAVVLGAGGVGKSALTVRFIRDVFVENYDPTIEEEYHRIVELDGESYSLEILDTAGAEQFKALNESYIKCGRGFILVFSLAQEATLREVDSLRQQIYRVKGENSNVPIVVVGTKMDLPNEREVQQSTIEELSARWGLRFYETSAKRNWNVKEAFEDLVRQMRDRYPQEPSRRKKVTKNCIVM